MKQVPLMMALSAGSAVAQEGTISALGTIPNPITDSNTMPDKIKMVFKIALSLIDGIWVKGSWFVVRGLWFVDRGSWFVDRGS